MQAKAALAIAAMGVAAFKGAPSSAEDHADFPAGYRSWTHVKSAIIEPDHPVFGASSAGIHHIYANPIALKGYADRDFQPGAVIVADFLGLDAQNDLQLESARLRIDVMQFDPDRFSDTDGWGYASYAKADPDLKVDQDAAQNCHGCHLGAAESGFVFSRYRD